MALSKKSRVIAIAIGLIALAGFLGFCLSKQDQHPHGQQAYDHTAAILAIGPRTAGSEGLKKAHRYISEELKKSGWTTVTQTVERDTPVGKRTFINLIARYDAAGIKTFEDAAKLPAKGILSAHLDSKEIPHLPNFLGADDAASACALMIVIAETLAKENPELAKQLELVFFDGEEAFNKDMSLETGDGLYGSRAYAITLYQRDPKPKFGINLDMVGHHDLQIAVPADSPTHLYHSLQRAAAKFGVQKHFGMADGGILDDHYYLNKAGVPTIDIIGADFHDSHWWHQEGDTMELISAKSLDISYQVTIEMLRELLP
ncbi:M28 family peptidase [Verrucomicrobiaceae bacterium N1E253]|uniref:M28 family peptidase n=1 Tax=Oceaniferula marina TaxID=2748318 RepID=A0A851GAZ7_9BACT|nr:M28 family peptidase [Oceaniferula marina]NWK54783.1 M28 family peptidase [Oceaniferula marina]